MITKNQLKILEFLKKDFFKKWIFSELKESLKETSNSKLQKAIKDFERENLIIIDRKKGYNSINLNLNSSVLLNYFLLIDSEKFKGKILKILNEVRTEILEETTLFSMVVFGSSSNGVVRKDSDLDLVLIFENKKIIQKVMPKINSIKRKSIIKLDEYYFSEKEFLEMLKSKKENLGKEIGNNFLTFYGGELFYNLIFENGKFS